MLGEFLSFLEHKLMKGLSPPKCSDTLEKIGYIQGKDPLKSTTIFIH